MKRGRLIKRVTVFVLVGMVINLAIAWGSVLWRIAPRGSTQFTVADPNLPPLHLWALAQTGTFASMRIEAQEPASGGMPAFSGQMPRAFSDFIPRLFERSAEARSNGLGSSTIKATSPSEFRCSSWRRGAGRAWHFDANGTFGKAMR